VHRSRQVRHVARLADWLCREEEERSRRSSARCSSTSSGYRPWTCGVEPLSFAGDAAAGLPLRETSRGLPPRDKVLAQAPEHNGEGSGAQVLE